MLGGIENGWTRKTKRRATRKQVLSGKRNWQQLQIRGCTATLRQIAYDCKFSPVGYARIMHALHALSLCVDVKWHNQRREEK